MDWHARRRLFRALLEQDRCLNPAAVFDPISARAAELLGYKAAILPGSLASFAILGAPDLTLISLTELSQLALRLSRASTIPLIVDADHGYGNALNVARTVAELEISGASAITIEDTNLPLAFNSGGSNCLISIAEAVGKLQSAVAARTDPDFVIAGRSNAALTTLEDLVERAKAYEASGVDVLHLSSMQTRKQLQAIAEATKFLLCWAFRLRNYLTMRFCRRTG